MRIVLQRVREAWVQVRGEEVARIGPGLLLLVGIGRADGEEEVLFWAKRIPDMRIFPDENGKLNRSLRDVSGEVLCVSQFTLYADPLAGRRPDFAGAAPAERARPLYELFVQALRQEGLPVKSGIFGAHMEVGLVNDGPVTLILEGPRAK